MRIGPFTIEHFNFKVEESLGCSLKKSNAMALIFLRVFLLFLKHNPTNILFDLLRNSVKDIHRG